MCDLASHQHVICIGAGGELRKFLQYCPIGGAIDCIVDNDERKWNQIYKHLSFEIPIVSLDKALTMLRETVALVITVNPTYFYDILCQLNTFKELRYADIYWSYEILSKEIPRHVNDSLPASLRCYHTQRIPKIIHYAWFGGSSIPNRHQKYIEGWKEFCPEWEFICWNEHNYDITRNHYMHQAYLSKKWGFVPDYLRKDVIYRYGGIYLDTDVEIVKPLDDLLYQDGFCAFEGKRINFGLGCGGRKGLPIFKEMRDAYDSLTFEFKKREEMFIGPDYETNQLVERGLRLTGTYQHVAGLTVYPSDVLSGTLPFTAEPIITPVTYTVHHYAGSWDDSANRQKRNFSERLCTAIWEHACLELDNFL